MKLDDRLQQITRVEQDKERALQQKEYIMARHKRTTRLQLLTRQLAIASIACILLLFYFIDVKPAEQVLKQAQLTDELAEITVLQTNKANRNLNLNSIMYIEKKTTQDPQLLATLQRFITDPSLKEEPWDDGELLGYMRMYQLLLTFENGQQRYLKIAPHLAGYNIYDVYGKKKYVLKDIEKNGDGKQLQNLLDNIGRQTIFYGWKTYIWIAFFIFLIIDMVFISRNSYYRDEDGKKKELPILFRYVWSFFLVMPGFFVNEYLGTVHIGMIVLPMILVITLKEYLEVRQGIKQANWLWTFTACLLTLALLISIFT